MKFWPQCKSRDVGVTIGGQAGKWECKACGFQGPEFPEIEMTEDEFMKYLDEEDAKLK